MTFVVNLGKFLLIESADAFYRGYYLADDKKQSWYQLGSWYQVTSSNYHIGSLALMSLLEFTLGFIKYIPFLRDYSLFAEIKKVRKETLYYLMKSDKVIFEENLNFKRRGSESKSNEDNEKNNASQAKRTEKFDTFFAAGE